MAEVSALPAAGMDLIKIGDFIAPQKPERAASFVAGIEARMIEVAGRPGNFPGMGQAAPRPASCPVSDLLR